MYRLLWVTLTIIYEVIRSLSTSASSLFSETADPLLSSLSFRIQDIRYCSYLISLIFFLYSCEIFIMSSNRFLQMSIIWCDSWLIRNIKFIEENIHKLSVVVNSYLFSISIPFNSLFRLALKSWNIKTI